MAYYQRKTGPTYPQRGKILIENELVTYKLPRSSSGQAPVEIHIKNVSEKITGRLIYKRYKTDEPWTEMQLEFKENVLIGFLPGQPSAGKLMYKIVLNRGEKEFVLTDDPIVIRFTGEVPAYILWPHIIIMFMAMLFSTRAGIEALLKYDNIYSYTLITLILLALGGMFLGPVVQKFAFGAFWTGWPFGQDLTDNKTLVAFAFWLMAYFKVRKNRSHKGWILAASIMLLLVYLIPHSMFGSELDYSTGEVGTGK
jgi:hypothetical protein